MRPWIITGLLLVSFYGGSFGLQLVRAYSRGTVHVPEPAVEVVTQFGLQTAVFAGGCFWGVEAVFEQLKGVQNVVSGYAGGSAAAAHYDIVSGGGSQHAEAVRVIYDPNVVSYGQLLKVFFAVAHDPTQLNAQGPDRGYQYRSEIFYTDEAQRKAAEGYIAALSSSQSFPRTVVTKLSALPAFYPAEDYHQNYLKQHPNEPYIVVNDAPKVAQLRKQFPELTR